MFSIEASGMRETVDVSALNSRIKFDRIDVPFDQRTILGDATETGLTRFAARYLTTDYDAYVKAYPKAFESELRTSYHGHLMLTAESVPFNSTNKWALVVVSSANVFYQKKSIC